MSRFWNRFYPVLKNEILEYGFVYPSKKKNEPVLSESVFGHKLSTTRSKVE